MSNSAAAAAAAAAVEKDGVVELTPILKHAKSTDESSVFTTRYSYQHTPPRYYNSSNSSYHKKI